MGVDLKHIRIERLTRFAKSRDVLDDPTGLGLLIGKKPNQVYNLLNGVSSFGEKVARSIEEAAGLPRGWLDAEEPALPSGLLPDVAQLARTLNELPENQRRFVLETAALAISHAHLLADTPPEVPVRPESRQPASPERARKLR